MHLRRTLVAGASASLVVMASLASALPAGADESPPPPPPPPVCSPAQSVWGCAGGGPSGDGPGNEGGGGGSGAPLPIDFEYYFDDFGEGVGAEAGYEEGCWGIQTVPEGQGGTYQEAIAQQNAQGENGVLWGNCRIEDTIDPSVIAQALWQTQVAPPPPTPLQVQPGKAVTGLRAYLEIGGEVPATQTMGSPLGPITFTMTPRYVVSWGDGASVGTDSQGVPWPGGAGEITHVFQDAGGVTVTVQAFWRATWSLAGQGGDLAELPVPTEGNLDLPVEAYQVTTD